MAVISDYEEEEKPVQSHTSESEPSEEADEPPELEKPPKETEQEEHDSPPPSPSPTPQVFKHDPALRALLDEHKSEPLEFLTTVIDFLLRETDFSQESKVDEIVADIIKKRTGAEDAASEKILKIPKKEANSPSKTPSKTPYQTPRGFETPDAPPYTEPPTRKDLGLEQAEIDAEGTGLPPNIGNGYDHEKYSWTQTLGELTLHVHMPEGTKAKAVECDIKRSTLKAGIKGQEPIIEGDFYAAVKVDDCFWSLDEDMTLSIYVTKFNQMEWWRSVLKGEPEINTRKVEPEKSRLDDLDAETRQTAEKMMYDQRQKAMGLPTSDDSNKNEMLKKFMSQHPEMDFSKAKMC